MLTGSSDNISLRGLDGDDMLISNSLAVGTNPFIEAILTNNPQPISGQGGTQDLVYNADTGNFYQYVFDFLNAGGISSAIAAGSINGVTGNLVTFESQAEVDFVLNNLGADFGGAPSFSNPTIVGDSDISAAVVTNSPLTTLSTNGTFGSSAGFVPYIVEFDGDAILGANNNPSTGPAQPTTLNGGAGNDQLFGSGGIDVFLFEATTAFGAANRDTIFDFDESDGDILDISDILSGQGISVTAGNLNQFVQVDQFNGLRVDVTGNGQFFNAANPIATFDNPSAGLDEVALFNNGQLIV